MFLQIQHRAGQLLIQKGKLGKFVSFFKHFIVSFQLPIPHISGVRKTSHTTVINRQDESNPQSSVALKHDSHLKALCTATAYLTIQSTIPCTKANTYSAWIHSSLQSIPKTYKLSYTWLRLDKNNIEYNKLKINTGELLFLFCLQVGVWTQSLTRPCYSERQVIQSWYQYISETLVLLRFLSF